MTQGPDPTAAVLTTGNGVAALLLGTGAGGGIALNANAALDKGWYGWYFNDDFKLLGKGMAVGASQLEPVCNGGISTGALAIGDEEPELTATILTTRLNRSSCRWSSTPSGRKEGPGYWHYATRYTSVPF